MADFVTGLATFGPVLTKIFKAGGKTEAYDDAASFTTKQLPVADIKALSRLLTKLQDKSQHCVIRGEYVGDDKAEKGKLEGSIARTNTNFNDCPHHWFMVDIDKYEPGFADPVHEPVEAIKDYLAEQLPASFKDVSFHWQLSSSAGAPGKAHILKAHVWFWSETAYTSAQMYEWAKAVGPRVDKAVYRRVQIHYTANPIFEDGVPDPVPVRSGFYQGARDTVPLKLDQGLLDSARAPGSGTGGNDMKLVDPSEKENLIGLYHRIFEPHTVLMEHLEGMFEPGQNDRRWTWLDGGGTPEGVWVHDDGMHVGATHNTWPIDGLVNLWDLVRVLKFGHLDKSDDDFEQFDIDESSIQAKPSHVAMLKWVADLPEIREAVREERTSKLDGLKDEIAAATDYIDLEQRVALLIRGEPKLSLAEREQLATAFKDRMHALAKIKMPIGAVRQLLAPKVDTASNDAPGWAQEWVWDRETDCFVNRTTKISISERSYNASFDRKMGEYADQHGNVPKASDYALRMWNTTVVDRSLYNPQYDELFHMDGVFHFNLYDPDSGAPMPGKFIEQDFEAFDILMEHAELLIPDTREHTLFFDYLAYCVSNPGAKIRWAPLLKGVEGDGKSAFVTLMALCMGQRNVRILDSATLEKSDFSGWGTGQSFTGVEEVKLHGHNKYDIYNKLKPYISNDFIEVHKKGKDPYNAPNTTNYLLLSNFDDAVPITDNDRRVMFIRSPFNTKEQLFAEIRRRTGLSPGEYFDRLFDKAMKNHKGAIRKWFMERELSPEFSADGRAPITSARDIAVGLAVRDDESAVQAAIEEQGLGVYHRIVSTWHLSSLVRNRYEIDLRSSRVSAVLSAAGFKPIPGQVKWRGRPCRFYYLGDAPPDGIQAHLEALEKARETDLVDGDFAD